MHVFALAQKCVPRIGQKLMSCISTGMRISIEGNMGSGKSTVMKELMEARKDVQLVMEPVDKWQDIAGFNALDLMFKNPKRWGYLFQSYVLYTMTQNHCVTQKAPFLLIERSIYSALFCFVENLYQSGNMTELEYRVHHKWFDWIILQPIPKLDLIVYLRTTPDVCLERVKKRGRYEETEINYDFIKQVHNHHEDWLVTRRKFYLPAPVVVVNGNTSISDVVENYNNTVDPLFYLNTPSEDKTVCQGKAHNVMPQS